MRTRDIETIKNAIKVALPDNCIVPAHTNKEHFYKITDTFVSDILKKDYVVYPSVTGKLQSIKDPSISNFKMNRAVEYIFQNYRSFTDDNIIDHLDKAKQAPVDMFEEAGFIGTDIHDVRESYVNDFIENGKRPDSKTLEKFIPPEKVDPRIKSGLAAFDRFVQDFDYVPVHCELLVYSHKWKTAGTLDDLGVMKWPIGKVNPQEWYGIGWDEEVQYDEKRNVGIGLSSGRKFKLQFVLADQKTSNQIKAQYYFQVATYWRMFVDLVGIKPDLTLIVKLDKNDRTYKLQEVSKISRLAVYVNSIIAMGKGLDIIKDLQKDNLKNVIEI